jgi:transcriptional regulator with XRE-family HTH domain
LTWRNRLRVAVERSGAKHSAIARAAGIAPETLSRILNDADTHPRFETVARIANAAGVRVGWLMGEPVRGIELTARDRAAIFAAGVILFEALTRPAISGDVRQSCYSRRSKR